MTEIKSYYAENDLMSRLSHEFKHDPLFNIIKERETLKKELFDQIFLNNLEEDVHKTYSIAEAGRVLGGDKPLAASSLKYYIDEDGLGQYIRESDTPGYIRLNYRELFRLRMVWLLKDELKLAGLKAEVGLVGIMVNRHQTAATQSVSNEKDLQTYKAMTELMFKQFMERDELGNISTKKGIKQLLESPLLLEGANILETLEKQEEQIQSLEKRLEEEKNHVALLESRLKLELKEELSEDQLKAYEKQEKQIKALKEHFDQEQNHLKKLEESLKVQIKDELSEDQVKRIRESEDKLINLTEKYRIKQKEAEAKEIAEREFDKKGPFAKLFQNRSEFVSKRVKEVLEMMSKE